MLGFVIGDHDMATGFRLVGINGVEVSSVETAKEALFKAIERKDLSIVLISEEFSSQIRPDIDKLRSERNLPVILEIPGSKGPSAEVRLSDFVGKVLGMKV